MHWIERLKQDESKTLQDIYRAYRSVCVAWLQSQFSIREDEALDIFQLSVVILYDNAMMGKVKCESGDLKSYLFGIARNKAFELLRQNKKAMVVADSNILLAYLADEASDMQIEESLNRATFALDNLGDPCKSIIQMYYYMNHNMEEITQKLGYKNSDTTKNQKYKCLKRLQSIYFDHQMKNEGDEK